MILGGLVSTPCILLVSLIHELDGALPPESFRHLMGNANEFAIHKRNWLSLGFTGTRQYCILSTRHPTNICLQLFPHALCRILKWMYTVIFGSSVFTETHCAIEGCCHLGKIKSPWFIAEKIAVSPIGHLGGAASSRVHGCKNTLKARKLNTRRKMCGSSAKIF